MAENDAPEKGITIQQALELATDAERDILSILMRGGSIKTNRGMLEAARLINKHFRLETRADLGAPRSLEQGDAVRSKALNELFGKANEALAAGRNPVEVTAQTICAAYNAGWVRATGSDAVRQARRETWEAATLAVKAEIERCADFGMFPGWHDFEIALSAAALHAEGEKREPDVS